MLSRFFVIALCVGVTYAATWMGYTPMKPKGFEDKEGCYVKEINDVVPFGKTVHPIGHCYRIQCSERMMHYASCGVISLAPDADPRCYITDVDLRKPYPDCCPTFKCDLDNKID